ncbi:MAG: polyphenol oxidase family protein [Acidimicrobiaceae bacterium]|nr:polyphenol oxidase family protein [Acidimicrobiaceae bacterium]
MIRRSLPAGSGHVVRVRCSERRDGDYSVHSDPETLARARNFLAPGSWTWLQQVHGASVVVVDAPGARCGASADASVTGCIDAVLSVQTADCASLVLAAEGLVGIVHAGWRGIVEGVIGATFDVLRRLGGEEVHALLGPCIAPASYQFGRADLDLVAAVVGDCVRSRTADGSLALDLPAAVSAQCNMAGVSSFSVVGPPDSAKPFDTAGSRWYSHRTRGESERQATVAWLEKT